LPRSEKSTDVTLQTDNKEKNIYNPIDFSLRGIIPSCEERERSVRNDKGTVIIGSYNGMFTKEADFVQQHLKVGCLNKA
jgi:hypothetical protein